VGRGRWKPRFRPCRSATGPASAPPDHPPPRGRRPKTVRGRARTPAFLRQHARLAVDGPVFEKWKLGYLIDTIYLRDLWMHRIDAAPAAERLSLDAVEFCRTLAGRAPAAGLLTTIVPF
jgi:hypothetical protein